jgi:DNA-binding response OmpR family regulator
MKSLKVLVVDDVASMRKFLKFGLEKSFPKILVDEAANGKEAQTKLEQMEYDLVLCDWEMPYVNGDELLSWVRNHPTLCRMPFIMVSSRSDKMSVLKARDRGVDSYMIKPFTVDNLAHKVMLLVDKADRRESERFAAHGDINLYFRDQVARGSIIDISMGGLFGEFSRKKNPVPSIFEEVRADIKLEDSQKKADEIQGFVIRLQAAEAFIDAENVKIAVKFLDSSGEGSKKIQQLIES